MSSPDDASAGFYARASQDATLKSVLGTKAGVVGTPARFYETWPTDTMQRTDFPRAAFFIVVPRTRRPGIYSVRLQVTGFFWPEPGSAAKRKTWTDRMLELFDEEGWTYGTTRLYAIVIQPGRDLPAGPDEPMSRLMELRIEVSPGPI